MTKDLTKGNPLSLILRFALPLLCGMLFPLAAIFVFRHIWKEQQNKSAVS